LLDFTDQRASIRLYDAPERRDDKYLLYMVTNALKDIIGETSDNEEATNNNDTILDPGDVPPLRAGL
jgi:hypothetical protein